MRFIRKLVRSVRRRGLYGTWDFGVGHLHTLVMRALEERFDRRYGVDTGGLVEVEELEVGKVDGEINGYQGVSPFHFALMLGAARIRPEHYVFVDLGSGKGRALMMAARHGFKRLVGVELSPKLHRLARKNVSKFAAVVPDSPPFELHCAPAEQFELPREGLVLFLYNPFGSEVMKAVLEQVRRSLEASPRPLVLLYRNPVCAEQLDAQAWLECVRTADTYRIYRARPLICPQPFSLHEVTAHDPRHPRPALLLRSRGDPRLLP